MLKTWKLTDEDLLRAVTDYLEKDRGINIAREIKLNPEMTRGRIITRPGNGVVVVMGSPSEVDAYKIG